MEIEVVKLRTSKELKKLIDVLDNKIRFQLDTDYLTEWTLEEIAREVERQTEEHLKKKGIDVNRVKDYNWDIVVEVKC
jgi:hypothetical protein